MVDRRSLVVAAPASTIPMGGLTARSVAQSGAGPAMSRRQATPDPESATPETGTARPLTVVLVHGAWADAASWSGVIQGLSEDNVTVVAPANPLRSLTSDAAYLASFLDSLEGPVLLVGHSYGGAVMSIAAAGSPNVVGLVYVAAYALEVGETLLDIANRYPVATLGPALRQVPIPGGTPENPAIDVYLDRAMLPSVFAADVEPAMQEVLAATQRPIAYVAFGEPAGAAAWKDLPSWALVATADQTLGSAVPAMAERAGSVVTPVDSSHAVPVARPADVVAIIRTAIASLT